MTPTKETIQFAERMSDPANRYYRYPVARWILPAFLPTPITPNQVSVAHTLMGITGAWFVSQGTSCGLLIGFFLLEFRMILDCLDGVLARAKKLSSTCGGKLDEFGDMTVFLALVIGMAMHVAKHLPLAPYGTVSVLLVLVGIFMEWGHDFYHRQLTGALRHGRDIIFEDLLEKTRRLRNGHLNLIDHFDYVVEWAQVIVLQPSNRTALAERVDAAMAGRNEGDSGEVKYILRNHRTTSFRTLIRWVNLMCGDNLFVCLHAACLIGGLLPAVWSGHAVFLGQVVAVLYGPSIVIAAIVASQSVLGARRDDIGMFDAPPSPAVHPQESNER